MVRDAFNVFLVLVLQITTLAVLGQPFILAGALTIGAGIILGWITSNRRQELLTIGPLDASVEAVATGYPASQGAPARLVVMVPAEALQVMEAVDEELTRDPGPDYPAAA